MLAKTRRIPPDRWRGLAPGRRRAGYTEGAFGRVVDRLQQSDAVNVLNGLRGRSLVLNGPARLSDVYRAADSPFIPKNSQITLNFRLNTRRLFRIVRELYRWSAIHRGHLADN